MAKEQKITKRRKRLGLHMVAIRTLRLVHNQVSAMGRTCNTNGKKWPSSDKVR